MRPYKSASNNEFYVFLLMFFVLTIITMSLSVPSWAQSYYVSSSTGSDSNDGLTQDRPMMSITKINSLNLRPGDRVLFKCGDTWRVETLIITKSGTEVDPVTFSSYPEGCASKPSISGSRAISGWDEYNGNIFVADLSKGNNSGLFTNGINQLFRNGKRLRLGRWPNLSEGDNGYSTIDSSTDGKTLTDNELPKVDWTGAVVHIKGMRWYILNREVAGSSGNTLTLGVAADCWGGCTGWGYFINNHLATLDQDGEWYYDGTLKKVYMYSNSGRPGDNEIEGSVIVSGDGAYWGGIILGLQLQTHITDVVIENLAVQNWYANGITTPVNLKTDDNSRIVIRNNIIKDVDSVGLNLATWVWSASNGVNGWRGGHNQTITGNIIDGANHFGIRSYSYNSLFQDNVVSNIGLIENVGVSGLGCGYKADGGVCTENGDGIWINADNVSYSGYNNTIKYNQILKTAYNGIEICGPNNLIENNFVKEACFAKADCGGIHAYGRTSLSATPVYNLTIRKNIVVDTVGNTDGATSTFKPLFGMGIFMDNYCRDVEVSGNTVINSSVDGILYNYASGLVSNNTMYGNSSSSTNTQGQVCLHEALVREFKDNILFGVRENARTLILFNKDEITDSDRNYFFQPYLTKSILISGLSATDNTKTLEEWKSYSGKDASSKKNWFTLGAGDKPISTIFYNATKVDMTVNLEGKSYLDLDQGLVKGSITIKPFESKILINKVTHSATPRYDFDGDGNSDVLWRNSSTGDIIIWLMKGTGIIRGDFVVKGLPIEWDIIAAGDFNGDGKGDILLYNRNNGDIYMWIMDVTTITNHGYVIRSVPKEWEFKAIGDFDGDGKADILWWNKTSGDVYLWSMDGTGIKNSGFIAKGMSSEWVVKSVADLNGDKKSDIVWQNSISGDVYLWIIDSTRVLGGDHIARGVPGDWQIKSVWDDTDFNGDGKADLLWQNTTTGDIYIYLMDGVSVIGGGYAASSVPANWQIKKIGDYNGDGKADLLWLDTTTGDIYIYLMDGKNIAGGGYPAHGLSSQWQVR
ncbi:MAG: VCBS repeat-containing protein [Nitrospirae bacterium]|nr:VCBS repeat-containing protein [Nitrospirota bacterium]